jgi:hypothetical protein
MKVSQTVEKNHVTLSPDISYTDRWAAMISTQVVIIIIIIIIIINGGRSVNNNASVGVG